MAESKNVMFRGIVTRDGKLTGADMPLSDEDKETTRQLTRNACIIRDKILAVAKGSISGQMASGGAWLAALQMTLVDLLTMGPFTPEERIEVAKGIGEAIVESLVGIPREERERDILNIAETRGVH